MNDRKDAGQGSQSPGLNIGDIYFILFRHKWKIIIFSVLGFLAAGVVYTFKKPLWGSEAELLVKYVVTPQPVGVSAGDIRNLDPRGDNILNSEVRIVTSYDVATNVVNAIGAERILAMTGGGSNLVRAAKTIRGNITVEPIRRTDILRITFEHPDREIVQPVLQQLILSYLELHAEIHTRLGISDTFLNNKLNSYSNALAQTEELLRLAKEKAGVPDIAEARKSYTEQIGKKQEEISNAEAELAGQEGMLSEINKHLATESTAPDTNAPAAVVPPERVEEYTTVKEDLADLQQRRKEYRRQGWTDSVDLVKDVQRRIDDLQHRKNSLEDRFPSLAGMSTPVAAAPGQPVNAYDPSNAALMARVLKAKLQKMNEQLVNLKAEAARIETNATTISDLQRKKEIQETEYRTCETSLMQARFKEALEAAKLSNITCYEQPTPPFRDVEKTKKLAMILAAGGLAVGLGLAFLLEFFLDQTVKRPAEVEARLRLPLFMSIPDTNQGANQLPGPRRNGHSRLKAPGPGPEPAPGSESGDHPNLAVALRDDKHGLRLFFEALRDRLFLHFDANNLKHNPKLVAVTSCAEGAGVTTVASGLAETLSETGQGNVLLVDMNDGQGAARPYFKGKPSCGLADALEGEKRASAMVQENLYVVAEGMNGGESLPSALPSQFNQLVPKLRASDYDYIIFDMPPVSQISVTTKWARLMDVNLLVVEAEKTSRDIVKQASAMISGAKPNLGVVLNKKRTYVPKWLMQEL